MSYHYEEQKPRLFTEEGQVLFLRVRDEAQKLLKTSGAFMSGTIFGRCGGGETWLMLTCLDRMVELGELVEIGQGRVAGQHRVFRGPL
jgi:hypothetical protein